MTTSINRLRNTLADIGANVSIFTEKGERDYHLAIYQKDEKSRHLDNCH